jgi:hypothetical protein
MLFQRRLETQGKERKTKDGRIHLFSGIRVTTFANTISVLLAVGWLLIPVFLLYLVPMHHGVMACVALGFILAFSATLSLFIGAGVQEVLIGTAA